MSFWADRRRGRSTAQVPPPGESVPVFEFDGVGVVIEDRQVLVGIDLEVPGRGITVVVGPSGSGKSTLARLCNRLLDPTRGVVRFRGVEATALDVLELRRRVGLVFQRPALFGGSVADNLVATGITDRSTFRDVLQRVQLDPDAVLSQEAASLSGGEAQRVCMARTLLLEPEVLVADEPTAAVDEATTHRLEGLARDMAAGGVPILWITHDLAQMQRLGDQAVVLVDGKIAATGPPAELVRSQDPVVRSFLTDSGDGTGQ